MSVMPDRYTCPVCGYGGLVEPPWSDGSGSDEICPSCGIHLGYDDVAGGDAGRREAIYRERRATWIAAGMPWWSPNRPPPGWDPEEQLRAVTE